MVFRIGLSSITFENLWVTPSDFMPSHHFITHPTQQDLAKLEMGIMTLKQHLRIKTGFVFNPNILR